MEVYKNSNYLNYVRTNIKKCLICNSTKDLQLHHLHIDQSYKRDDNYIIPVCGDYSNNCHDLLLHGGLVNRMNTTEDVIRIAKQRGFKIKKEFLVSGGENYKKLMLYAISLFSRYVAIKKDKHLKELLVNMLKDFENVKAIK